MIEYLLFLWHEMVGHPRPWHYLNASTYCGSCAREIKTFHGKRMLGSRHKGFLDVGKTYCVEPVLTATLTATWADDSNRRWTERRRKWPYQIA